MALGKTTDILGLMFIFQVAFILLVRLGLAGWSATNVLPILKVMVYIVIGALLGGSLFILWGLMILLMCELRKLK